MVIEDHGRTPGVQQNDASAEELGRGQRPDHGSLQEGSGPGDGMGHDKLGTGVHPFQRSERAEHHQGVCTREACGKAVEHSEHDPRETGGGASGLCGGDSGSGDSDGVARAPPSPSITVREPLELGTVGAAGGRGDSASQPAMGNQRNRVALCLPQALPHGLSHCLNHSSRGHSHQATSLPRHTQLFSASVPPPHCRGGQAAPRCRPPVSLAPTASASQVGEPVHPR